MFGTETYSDIYQDSQSWQRPSVWLGARCQPVTSTSGPSEANDRLRAEDPSAYEAKMLAQLPASKCFLCGSSSAGETFLGLQDSFIKELGILARATDTNKTNQRPPRTRAWRASRATGRSCCPMVPRVGAVSRPERDRRHVGGGRLGALSHSLPGAARFAFPFVCFAMASFRRFPFFLASVRLGRARGP